MTANRRHRRIRQPRCLQDRLHRAAQAAGVSESEVAREAIDDYLAKEPEPALRHVAHRQCTLCISMGMGSGSVSVRSGSCGVRGTGRGLGGRRGAGLGAGLGRTGGSGVGGPMVRRSGSRPTQSDLGEPRSHQSVGGSARMIFAAISTGVRLQNFHNSFAERE